MIKLPHKPKFYIRVEAKDGLFFNDIVEKVLLKKYDGKIYSQKRRYHGKLRHSAAKKAGIIHKPLDNDSKTYDIFMCPLDYGREMEECVKKALDIYCKYRDDKPLVITELKGVKQVKHRKKSVLLTRGRDNDKMFLLNCRRLNPFVT